MKVKWLDERDRHQRSEFVWITALTRFRFCLMLCVPLVRPADKVILDSLMLGDHGYVAELSRISAFDVQNSCESAQQQQADRGQQCARANDASEEDTAELTQAAAAAVAAMLL